MHNHFLLIIVWEGKKSTLIFIIEKTEASFKAKHRPKASFPMLVTEEWIVMATNIELPMKDWLPISVTEEFSLASGIRIRKKALSLMATADEWMNYHLCKWPTIISKIYTNFSNKKKIY